MRTELGKLSGKAESIAHSLTHAERILAVARGLHLCTAIESSLKIAETTHTTTQAFSSADLLHGPIASVPGQHSLSAAPARWQDQTDDDRSGGEARKSWGSGAHPLHRSPMPRFPSPTPVPSYSHHW